LKAGGVAEYDALLKIHEAPKIPSSGIAARFASDLEKKSLVITTNIQACIDLNF
jgi:hypothetical protein